MKLHSLVAGLLLLCLALTTDVYAIGRVYARLPNIENGTVYNLRIKSLKATVTIQDQLAVTSVDQEFANDNAIRLEGFYVFQLPEGAQVNEMYLWINGVRVPYQIKKRADAIITYTEIVRRIADPAILEDLGSNKFQLRIFPFDARGTRRIEISYSQPLTYYKGKIQYTFPLDMKDYTSAAIETASLSIRFDTQFLVNAVETSVDQFPASVKITKLTDRSYTIDYGVEKVSFAKDFTATFTLNRGSSSMFVLPYAAPAELHEDPYFIMWCALPDTLVKDSVKARELTFVADVSSSMEGTRLASLKEALNSFVDMLTESDKFNIIAFSTNTVKYRNNLVTATATARDSARLYITKLAALGLTNIEDALRTSLSQSYTDNVRSAIIFLTDGQASWGQTNTDSLLAIASRANTKQVRIFTVGVGDEPDVSLLQKLALQQSGTFTRISSDDSIYVKMKDFYRLLFLPQVKHIALNFTGWNVSDMHPTPIPDVYAGDQLRLTGRYTSKGLATVTLTGTAGLTPVVLNQQIFITDTAQSMPAIARYWGSQKIESLLALIAATGEKKELVDQVVALSMRYSVLTPYTAFLVVEPTSQSGTAVESSRSLPLTFGLDQNFPNPFNPSTTIRYRIASLAYVTLIVYDALGREVVVLADGLMVPGKYEAHWDALAAPSGVYFYVLRAGGFVATQRMVVIK
jgi:Ca-activated chloride channel homolog